jgi:hypothetical protein
MVAKDLLFYSKKLLSNNASKKVNHIEYGYPFEAIDVKVHKVFTDTINRYLKAQTLGYEPPICEERFEHLLSNFQLILGSNCCGTPNPEYKVNSFNYNVWATANPDCVLKPTWYQCAKGLCYQLGINLITKVTPEEIGKLTYSISASKVNCSLFYALKARKELCDLNYKLRVIPDEECKLEYKLLKQKFECNLTLKQYKTILCKDFSPKLISKLYECGITLRADRSDTVLACFPEIEIDVENFDLANLDSNLIQQLNTFNIDLGEIESDYA